MFNEELKKTLRYNKKINPEKTNATIGRVIEVIKNVLTEEKKEKITKLKKIVPTDNLTKPLSEEEADSIVEYIDQLNLPKEQLQQIINQLRYSEISTEEAVETHKKFKIPVSKLEKNIVPVRGEGSWILDTKGRWYLDMDSNYSATNLGMSNKQLAQGLYNQAQLLVSMKEDRVQIARTRFLKEITDMMPKKLNCFYWQNSGGEAVDKAIKIGKAYTQSKDVVAFKNGFHGRTHGSVAVTWNKKYRKPFFLHDEDWVHFADFNDIDSVEETLDETNAKIVIMEMVQGEEAGNLPADPEFLKKLWKIVHKRNGVIIDDEVQAGFGRTAVKPGDWFACVSYNIVPDIMVIGKSFGGGYPVTAVVTKKEISNKMKPGYDGSTFGGNPMAMTSALIATRQMKEKKITENVVKRSQQLKKGLQQLADKHNVIKEIRGRGLMMAFSLGKPENVARVQNLLLENGVKSSLSTEEYLRILPPTIISKGEVEDFLERLDRSLQKL